MTDEEIKDKMYEFFTTKSSQTPISQIIAKRIFHNPNDEEKIFLNQAINRVKFGNETIERSCTLFVIELTEIIIGQLKND